MVEDTAANVRPIIRETSRLPQSYSIAVGAKRKKRTSTAGRVSRSATAFISAFSAKFGLGVIWLSEVRVGGLFRVAAPVVRSRTGLIVGSSPAARPRFPRLLVSSGILAVAIEPPSSFRTLDLEFCVSAKA